MSRAADARSRSRRSRSSTGWWPRGATSMAGWQLQDLDLRGRGDVLRAARPARRAAARRPPRPGRRGRPARPRRAGVPRGARTCRSTPTARGLYTPAELYDGLATGGLRTRHPRRPGLRLGAAHRARPARACSPRRCTTSRSTTRSTSASRGRRLVGVMGGHALARGSTRLRATPPGWDGRWPGPG